MIQERVTHNELFKMARAKLNTAVIGDILDTLGLVHQFLSPKIQPLNTDMMLVGMAMPVLEVDVYAMREENAHNPLMTKPFGMMFEALDDLKPDEVYIASGSSPRYALWGELMTTRAMHLGAAGAVLNGYSRDTHGVRKSGFPTFSYGAYAQDQGARGKVLDYRVAIEIDGISVRPGDVVVGDVDGVLIVPQDVASETFRLALEKANTESLVRKAIQNGMSTVEAFERFGVM